VVDSDFRFFPTVKDELFGYMIHPIDLATNKVMAAAGRQKVVDAIDLITIHNHVLPLGTVIWAAVEKAPGYTPEGLIAEIRRNAVRYREEDLRAVPSNEVIDPKIFHGRLRAVLDEAEAFVMRMPTEKIGLLFLKDGKVVQPDPVTWRTTLPMPDNVVATGRPVPKLLPLCSSATTSGLVPNPLL
jgi:hypothetical protein